ncbi:MAG: hypothetical protein PHX87_02325 [Candidatus Peribacteraceae bacterium]|nr:hypothetical protein [Candidatus Peribacteraceae bacterium]MDD5742243.1 hypothetical protein [Candidatus Peribacteraceae bacterium]
MQELHADPKRVAELSAKGIVIQAAQGDEVVADFWNHSEAEIRVTLEAMCERSETKLRFTLRARG